MRALANKFGAHLTFQHGESTGVIDLSQEDQPELPTVSVTPVEAMRALANFNRAYWQMLLQISGWSKAA